MDSTGCNGKTALHYAAQNAEADVMEELIGRGLKVDLTNTRWIGIYAPFLLHQATFSFSEGNQPSILPLEHEALTATSGMWSFC